MELASTRRLSPRAKRFSFLNILALRDFLLRHLGIARDRAERAQLLVRQALALDPALWAIYITIG